MNKSDAKITDRVHRRYIIRQGIMADAIIYLPKILNLLEKLPGKKLYKVDGSKTKVFKDLLGDMLPEGSKRIYFRLVGVSLWLEFDYQIRFGTYPDGSAAIQRDSTGFYLGGVIDGKLCMNGLEVDVAQHIEQAEKERELSWFAVKRKLDAIAELESQIKEIKSQTPGWAI